MALSKCSRFNCSEVHGLEKILNLDSLVKRHSGAFYEFINLEPDNP
jgi:hypothetical protein